MAAHSLQQASPVDTLMDDYKRTLPLPAPKGAPTELQTLLKGDSVFSLTDEFGEIIPSWSDFFRAFRRLKDLKNDAKFTTGTVLLNKERHDSKFNLKIRWENGKFEMLSKDFGTAHIAYGDRLFVLERDCIGKGSKVSLAGYPDIKGTVKDKRFLATGRCTENPDAIFEDVDVSLLHRHTHGAAYKDVKIFYRDRWLGVTSNFRTRLHLKLKSACNGFDTFCLVLDRHLSQNYNIGDEMTLGLKLLWTGRLTGVDEIESANWLQNAWKFYNAKAIITDIEIDELHVHWIGKAGDGDLDHIPLNFPDSPSNIIPYHEMKNVQYLFGTKQYHLTPNSIWKYKHNPDAVKGKDNPIPVEKWANKWLKLVDWDRWNYPPAVDLLEKSRFWNRKLTLEIMYIRSVVDVIWQNGKENTLNSGDVIPLYLGSLWSDWSLFRNGTIVGNRMDKQGQTKNYGVILELDADENAIVNWIQPGGNQDQNSEIVETSQVPLYNLVMEDKYDFLSRLNQFPLVFSTDGSFEVGVVTGVKASTGQVRVKVSKEKEKKMWPHQLSHFNCDVMTCPLEGYWAAWYDHITPHTKLSCVAPEGINKDEALGIREEENPSSNTTKQLSFADKVPAENIFAKNNIPSSLLDSNSFWNAVEDELKEIQEIIPDGIWIEYYSNPGNVMSSVMVGPKGSLFEDILFVFDIALQEDFPASLPLLNFRSMGITIIPGHFCNTGSVDIPEETKQTEEKLTCSEILNLLLEMKDYMGTPLDIICESYKISYDDMSVTLVAGQDVNCDELGRFVLISALDYIVAVLRDPPRNWSEVINSHYARSLPRIVKRFSQNLGELKKVADSLDDDRGDLTRVEAEIELAAHPWSKAYIDSFNERLQELKNIHDTINS